jgi:N4-(beta-N-acetylglucosaminyl)-L-asparaginase
MTTSSGLAWKLPGRCGDSPIIGAGCHTDQDVGSAGATGSGEENIRVAGAHTVIENMRKGMSPQEAGLDALKRIARNFNNDQNKVAYILRKGGLCRLTMWSEYGAPARFCVHDGQKRLEPMHPGAKWIAARRELFSAGRRLDIALGRRIPRVARARAGSLPATVVCLAI